MDNKPKFRGDENRKKISEKYFVNPISYVCLFEPVMGECGKELTRARYTIELVNKTKVDEKGKPLKRYHILGYYSAEKLLDLVGKDYLLLYNVFDDEYEISENGKNKSISKQSLNNSLNKLPKLNRELFRAVSLIVVAMNITEVKWTWNSILYFSQKEKEIDREFVLKLNETLQKCNTSISKLCNEIEEKSNKKIKIPNLSLSKQILLDKGLKEDAILL